MVKCTSYAIDAKYSLWRSSFTRYNRK
jgi:hypothetical protein